MALFRRRLIRVRQEVRGTHVAGDVNMVVTVGPEADLDAASKRLAEKVLSDLEAQIGRLQLSRPVPIAVRWSSTGRPVQGPASVLTGAEQRLAGDVTQLSELMRGGLLRRQLVILGAPGAGKSVAALLLARDLARQLDPKERVPVLLSLSSWRPGVDLRSWIAKHVLALCPALAADYGRDMAERLVGAARVMLVLDGLDELPRSLHAPAVEAIDKAVADGVPLLVTCRAAEYELVVAQSCQYLTRAAVIELEPVDAHTATGFLQASYPEADARWDPIFKRLRSEPGSPLGRALSSPLMLYLARAAYRSGAKDPRELLDPVRFGSQDAVEDHLLEIFIPTVYEKSRDIRYAPRPARRWLRFMARKMRRDGTVDFTWRQVRSPLPVLLSSLLFCGVLSWFGYLFYGIRGGISVIVAAALICGLRKPANAPDDVHGDPTSVLRRRGFADFLVSAIIACAALLGVAYWLSVIVGVASKTAWEYGAAVGVCLGGAVLLGTDWGICKLSHAWFWLTRRLPWRLTAFLQEAHRLGVLRLTGSEYQFRHVRLLEQLSGATWTSGPLKDAESRESETRRRWWTPFRANLPLAGATLILGPLLVMGSIAGGTGGDGLSYQSGDKPATRGPLCPQAPQEGVPSCILSILAWELRANSTMQTALEPTPFLDAHSAAAAGTDLGIKALAGSLEISGCAHSTVQVTITVSGLRLRSFVMGLGSSSVSDPPPLPRELHGNPLVEITLRRLDAQPCTLNFEWISPEVSYDPFKHILKRLS
jgi:NACHT domain-containing protein